MCFDIFIKNLLNTSILEWRYPNFFVILSIFILGT